MKNLQEEKLAILKNVNEKELTKKELNDLGINDYYIRVFIEADFISRISRGNYKVSFAKNDKIENTKEMFKYFNRFKFKVLNGRYFEAYDALMENYRLQSSHDYDNHMRIYFILLKELIGRNYDFSPLEDLLEFTEERTDTYYDYFIDFRISIKEGNFYDAKIYLEKYALEEKRELGENAVSTILFTNMLEDVLRKIENSCNTQSNPDAFNENYKKLLNAIFRRDYHEALSYVESCIFSSKTERMTLMMKNIRLILNDIIALKEENINISPNRVDYSRTPSIYSKFNWALKAKDYYKAQEMLDEIIKNDDRGIYKTIKRLVDAILKLMRDQNAKSKEVKVEEKIIDPETIKKINSPLDSVMAYKIFLREYEEGHYENALYHLEICMLKDAASSHKKNNEKLCNLLKELIDMKKNKHGLKEIDIDYSDCKDTSEIFNKALENKDYKTAFRNSGKITYQNNSKMLSLFKGMLYEAYDLDKKYGSINVSKEKDIESKPLANTTSDKFDNFEEVLTNYVNEGKYEELFVLLQEKKETRSLNRLESIVFKLIKIYNSVLKGYYEEPEHVYLSNEKDYLGRFFEAIRCEDVDTAYGEIACIYGNVDNPQEFDVFEIILKDIIDKKEALEDEKRINVLSEEISTLIKGKKELDMGDIEELYSRVYDLQDISDNEVVQIILGLLEFIELANKGIIDASYLADLGNKVTLDDGEEINFSVPLKKTDALMFYLRNGDYISALKNINYLDTDNFNKQEIMIIKSLLIILNNALEKSKEYNAEYEEIPENHVHNIEKLVKKYDFYAAYNYILEHDLDDRVLYDIFPIIFGGMALTLIEQDELYRDFYKFIDENKRMEARVNMLTYKERLDKSSLGNVESLQEKYKEMQKRLQK